MEKNQLMYEGEAIYRQIAQRWPGFSPNALHGEHELTAYLNDRYSAPMASSYSNNLLIEIIDTKKLEIVYVSPNIEQFCGFSAEETIAKGVWQWMESLTEKELLFQLQNAQFVNAHLKEKYPPYTFVHSFLINGGVKTKRGEKKRILCSNYTLDWDENGDQRYNLFLCLDATHLFKGNAAIWRHVFGQKQPDIWSYNTRDNMFQNTDLFCTKEREILFLLSQGKNNEEMSDLLHVPASIVDERLKNMVRRMEVHNTNNLLEIARWIKLL